MTPPVPTRPGIDVAVETVAVSAYEIPTEQPESDGTLGWDSTTMVVVEVKGGDRTGLGYTYGDVAAAKLVESKLADVVESRDAMAVPAAWEAMVKGDPERTGVMEKSLRGKLVEFTEHLRS